jgi:hypothetical protein
MQEASADLCAPWPAERRIAWTCSDRVDDLYFSTDQKAGVEVPPSAPKATGLLSRPARYTIHALHVGLGKTGRGRALASTGAARRAEGMGGPGCKMGKGDDRPWI